MSVERLFLRHQCYVTENFVLAQIVESTQDGVAVAVGLEDLESWQNEFRRFDAPWCLCSS